MFFQVAACVPGLYVTSNTCPGAVPAALAYAL